MNTLLLVAAGGAAGSIVRYSLSSWIKNLMPSAGFPWGIFIVNVSGCFLFGLLQGWCHARGGDAWKMFVLTGVLGGYTTFSTFGWDTFSLFQRGLPGLAAVNAIASVVFGVLSVWVGVVLGGRAPQ